MNWRENPTRVAWLILSVNLLACCLLAVLAPLAVRSFLLHATRTDSVFVEATDGTVQLLPSGAGDPRAVTERRLVDEGSRLVTDPTARALLTVSEDEDGERVLATVQLWQDTSVAISRARTPRFGLSEDPHRLVLDLEKGRVFVATQQNDDRSVDVRLATPQAEIEFGIGTYDVIIGGEETQVRVRAGEAGVRAAGRAVTASGGQRVSVVAGMPPDEPVPDTVNLVLNGSFEGSLAPLWSQFGEVKQGHPAGKVVIIEDEQRRALRFSRRTEDGVPNRVGVEQNVDRDVQGYDSLALRLDLKLLHQSVPGGGEKATEYPVMVDIDYTDIYGKDLHWYQGFYYLPLPPGSPYLAPTGESVPLGVWYSYESPNLFELLSETRPARINSLSIYAIGHDYDSLVSDVALTVR